MGFFKQHSSLQAALIAFEAAPPSCGLPAATSAGQPLAWVVYL
jgi:hypothetical protein